jgi:hypothetical protein
MATAVSESAQLPVPVLELPHWRVTFQPDRYVEERIPSVGRCVELVQQNKVSLRGWDFPHLSHLEEERAFVANYFASWIDFMGSIEYWRLYQSGQFLHLNAIEETVRSDWRSALEKAAQANLRERSRIDWANVPGYLSMINVLYQITEIFEFAARLSERGVYDNQIEVSIRLRHVRGFLLMWETERFWREIRAADTDELGRSWTVAVPMLIANRSELSLNAAVWFFERFHWLNPPMEVLRREQQTFLRGLV